MSFICIHELALSVGANSSVICYPENSQVNKKCLQLTAHTQPPTCVHACTTRAVLGWCIYTMQWHLYIQVYIHGIYTVYIIDFGTIIYNTYTDTLGFGAVGQIWSHLGFQINVYWIESGCYRMEISKNPWFYEENTKEILGKKPSKYYKITWSL